MLLVIVYFVVVGVIALGVGAGVQKLLKIATAGVVDTIFLGLAGVTLLATCWAFFLPLHGFFTLFIGALAVIMLAGAGVAQGVINRGMALLRDVKRLGIFVVIVAVVALAASLPAYMLDNETYYIHTIKWLNQYGFVVGLGNLHIFFSQQSGLHILQAALDFDTLYDRYNDISAFYLLVGLCWSAFAKAESPATYTVWYKKCFPVALLLFLLLATAPTTDLPVYVLSYYAIYKFMVLWERGDPRQLVILAVLTLLVAYFKVTATLLVMLPVLLLVKERGLKTAHIATILGSGLLFLGLFVVKNIIVTGAPLYPVTMWTPVPVSWQVHPVFASPFKDVTAALPLPLSSGQQGWLDQASTWLFQGGLETYLNLFIIASCLCAMLFLWKLKNASIRWVFVLFLVQSLVLFFTSTQFRFFFNLQYPALVLMLLSLLHAHHWVLRGLVTAGIGAGILVFIAPQLINTLTDNPAMNKKLQLKASMFIVPSSRSRFSKAAHRSREGNMLYYHAVEDDYFWSTNDAPLPAVQTKYLEYSKRYYKTRPQLRTGDLKDGFYADDTF